MAISCNKSSTEATPSNLLQTPLHALLNVRLAWSREHLKHLELTKKTPKYLVSETQVSPASPARIGEQLTNNGYRCSLDHAKRAFNKACNGVCSKLLGVASEELLLHLISVKCLPILLYATEIMPLNSAVINSLNFCVMRFAMRIFKSNNRILVNDYLTFMGFELPSVLIAKRSVNFLTRLIARLTTCFANTTLFNWLSIFFSFLSVNRFRCK